MDNKIKPKMFFYVFLLFIFSGIFKTISANSDNSLILPIKFIHGIPVASVQIQNHDIPLMLDSGASDVVIALNKNIINRLHLKVSPINRKVCSHDDVGKKRCSKIYIIPEIKIGNMTLCNISCQLIDKSWGSHDAGFVLSEGAENGVIGLNLLRRFNVLIDYKASRIILSRLGEYPQQYNIGNWLQLPFSNEYGITTFNQINGINSSLVWDTGANGSTIKSTAKISASVNKKSCYHKNNPYCQYFETTTFTVGDQQLPKTQFFIREHMFPFDGLVGADFFEKHLVFFDFKNNLMFIKL